VYQFLNKTFIRFQENKVSVSYLMKHIGIATLSEAQREALEKRLLERDDQSFCSSCMGILSGTDLLGEEIFQHVQQKFAAINAINLTISIEFDEPPVLDLARV
jgi:hypothetical protein